MLTHKSAGILLHPTSLPSPHGIGDMGGITRDLLPFLKETGQQFWQILPYHPVGFGASPYQSYSVFAGDERWIDPQQWCEMDLLDTADLEDMPDFHESKVEFERVCKWKWHLYKAAFSRFKETPPPQEYKVFVDENDNWLRDYCTYRAIKDQMEEVPWTQWPMELKNREPAAIQAFQQQHQDLMELYAFLQYTFFAQWQDVRQEFNRAGIRIIGDMPIFAAHDSADVWSNPTLFQLDHEGNPTVLAGVPPDYYSISGQRWGNPHYQWHHMKADDFLWWRKRIQGMLTHVDVIRIDHFRGLEAYWEIDAKAKTAVNGRWVKAPGKELFAALEKHLGKLPLIAEDLGMITPEVEALKHAYQLPGMKILQFSFGRKLHKKMRPAHYEKHTFAYTGTHDNDTLAGWIQEVASKKKEIADNLSHYHQIDLNEPVDQVCWQLIELLMNTNAGAVIIPFQDYLCLDNEARMNHPGTIGGENWRWRCSRANLRDPALMKRILEVTRNSNRF